MVTIKERNIEKSQENQRKCKKSLLITKIFENVEIVIENRKVIEVEYEVGY